MSLARQILSQVDLNVNVPIHASLQGQPDALVINDDNGTPIIGIIDEQPEIVPEFELDVDAREIGMLTVHECNEVQGTFNGTTRFLDYNDEINQGEHVWRILRRDRNPATWNTVYWLVRIVPNKDDN